MSNDFDKVLITDDKLDVKNKVSFGIFRGGSSVNYQTFAALSASPTSQVFSIQVPSESVVVDRRLLWRCKVTFKLTASGVVRPAGRYLIEYGNTDGFCSFPLHNLTSNMSAQINSTTVNFQTQDLLPMIQKMFPEEALGHYNSYTPTYQDKYFKYADGVGANNNPLGSYANSADSKLIGRGSWQIDDVYYLVAGVKTRPIVDTANEIYITATFTEPLFLSPFTYAPDADDQPGLYGIQNMSFNFNMNPNGRIWRSASGYVASCDVQSFDTAELLVNFITPKNSQLIPSRNSVKYYEIPRFISSSQTIPAGVNNNGIITPGSLQIDSPTVQLNQVPQYLICFCRKLASANSVNTPDVFFTPSQISIQFNNVSGLLSSCTKQDLYRMSAHNHLNMPYQEWSGVGNVYNGPNTTGVRQIPLIGGGLILMFGKDITLQEDYLTISSLGNFNLQVRARIDNYDVDAHAVELVLATVNNGIFVSERGTSASLTGIITRNDTLDALNQEAMPEADLRRMVGKGFMENLASMIKVAAKNAPAVVQKICDVAPSVLKAVVSGEGRAGAGMSAGLMKRLK
jgi:hypothetical protein